MSWLLMQKALVAGELTPEEPSLQSFVFQKDPVCLQDSIQENQVKVPAPLKWLLKKSLSLYKRAAHLADLEAKSLKTILAQDPENDFETW